VSVLVQWRWLARGAECLDPPTPVCTTHFASNSSAHISRHGRLAPRLTLRQLRRLLRQNVYRFTRTSTAAGYHEHLITVAYPSGCMGRTCNPDVASSKPGEGADDFFPFIFPVFSCAGGLRSEAASVAKPRTHPAAWSAPMAHPKAAMRGW
jgi:hypothetical protein